LVFTGYMAQHKVKLAQHIDEWCVLQSEQQDGGWCQEEKGGQHDTHLGGPYGGHSSTSEFCEEDPTY